MKKFASTETSPSEQDTDMYKTFWRWFSFSVLALVLAAALPAFSADVFIDEGDSDFAATPVTTPTENASEKTPDAKSDKKPASDDAPPSLDLDAPTDAPSPEGAPPSSTDAMGGIPVESAPVLDPVPEAVEKSVTEKKTSTKKKTEKKKSKKDGKSKTKKSAAKGKKDKKSDKKKTKKTAKKSYKKSATKNVTKNGTVTKSASKRKLASVGKFAGGRYATTSKTCSMESAPGAGDAVGTTKASRKLWVEDSGNTSYYKVYGKSGAAAYVSHDCF